MESRTKPSQQDPVHRSEHDRTTPRPRCCRRPAGVIPDGPLQIQYPPREESLANIVSAIGVDSRGIPVVVVQHHMPEGAPVFVEGTPDGNFTPRSSRSPMGPESASTSSTGRVYSRAPIRTVVTRQQHRHNHAGRLHDQQLRSGLRRRGRGAGICRRDPLDASGAIHLANEAGKVSAENLHNTLMVLLQSNFAAVATTAEWTDAAAAGAVLPKSNLVVSAIEGSAAAG